MFLNERIPQRETLYRREKSLFDHLYGILDVLYLHPMKRLSLSLLTLLILCFTAPCQDKAPDCALFKTGVYYSYPKNTLERYSCIRRGRNEIEKNLDTGDSTVWEVVWSGNCTYTMRYVRGNEQLKPKMEKFLEQHQMAFKVETITPDYYVYSAYVDEVSKKPVAMDTMWFHEKTDLVRNDRYWFVPNEAWLKKRHFKDTSQYAVLYLYRPGKLTNSLTPVPVYCNDTLVWSAKNKSGCIIMIKAEGSIELKSKLYKDSSAVRLDIKFGKRYYAKSMVHWGMYKRMYNFKLEMAAMKPEEGQPEFEEVTQ
jgi:hypothetical protein